jgi:uncharacterized protein
MVKNNFIFILCAISIVLCFTQCKKKKEDDGLTPDATFDKTTLFRNIGENIIIPAYTDLKTGVDSLQYLSNQFTANPSLINLSLLQNCFLKTYLRYERVSIFEFGPADKELIRVNFNSFPCDTTQINSKIDAGDYDLSTVADLDAKGFPALDFLLYGINRDNNTVLAKFTSIENRKKYLTTLVNELKSKTDAVTTAWSASGGNYITTFIDNTGTDVGSSLGLLVNQLNYDFETIKNYKVGIPLGKKTQGVILPEKVEAYYSQISKALAFEQLKTIENLYLGRNNKGIDGIGLDDYLLHLQAQYNGGLLADAIKSQLTKAINKLQPVPDPLSQTIINNPSLLDGAYVELQKQVVLFKTDMPSALGVLITYQDNDGD